MEHFKNQITIEPICFDCKHFIDDGQWKCQAFPNGIPDIILTGDDDHTKPLKEQTNSITFTPKDKK